MFWLILTIQEYFQERSKFLIAQCSDVSDLSELEELVQVRALEPLAKGNFDTQFATTNLLQRFHGGLYLNLGDDPGQRLSMKLLGPTCSFPSWFFQDKSAKEFVNIAHPLERTPRIPELHLQKINYIQEIKKIDRQLTNASKLAQNLGLTTEKSPLWEDAVFAKNFFWRHPNCLLHLEKEGLLQKWITFMGIKYGKQFCNIINDMVADLTKTNVHFHPLSKVCDKSWNYTQKGLYKFNTKKGEKIVCKKYSGREMDTIAQIAIYMFKQGGVSHIDLKNFSIYIKYVLIGDTLILWDITLCFKEHHGLPQISKN